VHVLFQIALETILLPTLVPEALCEVKVTRGEKEEPLVTSVANPTSTLDYIYIGSEFESRM
jgi:hypothetical protein